MGRQQEDALRLFVNNWIDVWEPEEWDEKEKDSRIWKALNDFVNKFVAFEAKNSKKLPRGGKEAKRDETEADSDKEGLQNKDGKDEKEAKGYEPGAESDGEGLQITDENEKRH